MAYKKAAFDFSMLAPEEGRRVLPETSQQADEPANGAKPEKPEKDAKRKAAKAAPKPAAGEGGAAAEVRSGRPTYKAPDTECVRMVFVLPVETKQMLKQALAGQFFGKFQSQVELVDAAIRAFVANGAKQHK